MNDEGTTGPVLDNQGEDFNSVAEDIYRSHGKAVLDQTDAEEDQVVVDRVVSAISGALEGLGDDERTQYVIGLVRGGIDKALEDVREGIRDDTKAIADVDKDAKRHLRENEELYRQTAIQEANAAGHDITLNGEHHSATPPTTQT